MTDEKLNDVPMTEASENGGMPPMEEGPPAVVPASTEPSPGGSAVQLFKRNRRFVIFGGFLIVAVVLIVILNSIPANPTETTSARQSTQAATEMRSLDEKAALAMVGYGLLPPEADGSIKPDRNMTRAEFAGLVSEVLRPGVNLTNKPSYADVLPNHPQYAAIEGLKLLFGYQKPTSPTGSDGQTTDRLSSQTSPRFEPDGLLKRSEAVKVISLALNLEQSGSTLADIIMLPGNDPILMASDQPLLRKDAARLFYLLINSRLPSPAPAFQVIGIR